MLRILIKPIGFGLSPTSRSFMCRSMATTTTNGTEAINNNKASLEQLALLEEKLVVQLPKFFNSSHNFTIYTPDLVFIDNIRGLRTQGLTQYSLQVNFIKLYHFVKYSSIKVELLNLVKNPEESYLRIRWRVITKPGLIQFALFFWKFRSSEKWKDGISTMHVNKEGKVYCHVCDNIDVNTDDIDNKQKQTIKNPLVNRDLNV